jgi:hypothetical protein
MTTGLYPTIFPGYVIYPKPYKIQAKGLFGMTQLGSTSYVGWMEEMKGRNNERKGDINKYVYLALFHDFLPSFLRSILLSFLPVLFPSFQYNFFPSFLTSNILPSFLLSFLPSFFSSCLPSNVRSSFLS